MTQRGNVTPGTAGHRITSDDLAHTSAAQVLITEPVIRNQQVDGPTEVEVRREKAVELSATGQSLSG